MTTPFNVNPNRITDTPTRGQCWVCDELDVIPIADQNRVPAICSEECRRAWVRMLDITPEPGGENGDVPNAGEAA